LQQSSLWNVKAFMEQDKDNSEYRAVGNVTDCGVFIFFEKVMTLDC